MGGPWRAGPDAGDDGFDGALLMAVSFGLKSALVGVDSTDQICSSSETPSTLEGPSDNQPTPLGPG